jgi:nitrite reductase/ring-hydroxylating ferredoxin subunit
MSQPDEYLNLLRMVDELVQAFENHPDERVREQAIALLSGVDSLHREGLTRLAAGLRAQGSFDAAVADPVVSILFGLYGLADLPIPEEPLSTPKLVQLRPRARWVDVARAGDLADGVMKAVDIEGVRVLLVRVQGEVRAFRNACPGTELPLDVGRLQGHELLCPWHGCRFDARTGARLDGGAGRLEVFPVASRDGQVQLAMALGG